MNTDEQSNEVSGKADIRRASFHTLGCKLNQAETAAVAAQFRERGIEIVPFRQPADLTYINTCTVTHTADSKSRQAIRQAVSASPGGRVVVAGCYSQIKPAEVASLEGVDLILGAREKFQVLNLLTEMVGNRTGRPLVYVTDSDELQTYDESSFISATSRTRAFLKVQEGCDYQCSYCIIPAARGRARSRLLADCLSEANRLVTAGYRELVLTGVNVGTWREGDLEFADLLEEVSDITGLRRLRISSIEPNLITPRLLELMAHHDNICPHLHVPLQHAADRILGAMHRRYKLADYRAVLKRIMSAIPEAAVGADVIVGFPGETQADFDLLAEALREMPLTYLHIFRYSARDGTVAASMADQVPPAERKRR
ncbi:MAG: tRNA (N(6)-L-threonylcarbamoyladenosine(37)-C(2))-methylthiotransferase MtaB, partial [Candidatus Neomarinimicrobiota bacterium]